MHIAEQGVGPLVLLLHGFPETWYSWRHQFQPLADAGYHVVAPDQRGYADTTCPDDVDQYTIMHTTGDVIGLVHALGETEAVLVGHDWGAPVVWQTSMFRPDIVRGVVGLSVPPQRREPGPPMALMEQRFGEHFYQIQFQRPGVVDGELAVDVKDTLRRFFAAASGEFVASGPAGEFFRSDGDAGIARVAPEITGFLDTMPRPDRLPPWVTEADIDAFAKQHARVKFTGGLNWYRNMDRNWELLAPWEGARVIPPSLYITGTWDPVRVFGDPNFIEKLPEIAPNLSGVVDLDGCGHWTQQERPNEVNTALVEFLDAL